MNGHLITLTTASMLLGGNECYRKTSHIIFDTLLVVISFFFSICYGCKVSISSGNPQIGARWGPAPLILGRA